MVCLCVCQYCDRLMCWLGGAVAVVCLCVCQSLSLAHVLTPCILMFVLALVHTQIMVSCGMSKKSRHLVNSARYYIPDVVLQLNSFSVV